MENKEIQELSSKISQGFAETKQGYDALTALRVGGASASLMVMGQEGEKASLYQIKIPVDSAEALLVSVLPSLKTTLQAVIKEVQAAKDEFDAQDIPGPGKGK